MVGVIVNCYRIDFVLKIRWKFLFSFYLICYYISCYNEYIYISIYKFMVNKGLVVGNVMNRWVLICLVIIWLRLIILDVLVFK